VQELEGSVARQIAKLAKGNTPYNKHHAQFMNVVGWGEKDISLSFFFSRRVNPLLAGSWNWFWAVIQSSGGEKFCIVYSWLFIFIINIIISTSISIISNIRYFLCCHIKLSLSQTMSFDFLSISPPHPESK